MSSLTTQKETQRKRTYGSQGERTGRELGMLMYTLLYLKWVTTKDLLNSCGTLLNVMWQPRWEGGLGEKGYMYTYCRVFLLFT